MRSVLVACTAVVLVGLIFMLTGSLLAAREGKAQLVLDLYNRGWDAYDKGDYESAVQLFLDAGLHAPDNKELQAKVLFNIANISWELGADPTVTIYYFQEALRRDLDFYEAGFNLELYYELLRQLSTQPEGPGTGEGEGEGDTSGEI